MFRHRLDPTVFNLPWRYSSVRMLEFFFQVLLQGLLVAHQATAVLDDCCPVKQVQGQNQVMVDIFSFIGIPSQEPLKYAFPHNLNH